MREALIAATFIFAAFLFVPGFAFAACPPETDTCGAHLDGGCTPNPCGAGETCVQYGCCDEVPSIGV